MTNTYDSLIPPFSQTLTELAEYTKGSIDLSALENVEDIIRTPYAMQIPDLEVIVFHWTRTNGDCSDCGNPAAFYVDGVEEDYTKRCSVCAANYAADGGSISRIDN